MKILFQGDSITDTGRNAVSGSTVSIGQGYAMLVAAKLGATYPSKFTFENYAISGSRIVDVYARIKCDFWNHEPDVFSMLIGVNDVWHELGDGHNGVDAKRFTNVYRMMMSDTLERFPSMKIMLLEPFVLKCTATEGNWETFRRETLLRAEATRKVAEEFHCIFLPLQEMFDKAEKIAPANIWLADGVHPTPAGHQLIADAWLTAFEKNVLRS